MALFKIFNNIKTKNDLPTTYNTGYCYFDVNTGKFYIDTTNTAEGRIPINGEMADKLRNERTITLSGDVTGSVNFDGTKNVNIVTAVAPDSHTHDTQYLRRDGKNTMTGNLNFSSGTAITWNTDNVRQRIQTTDDGSANTAVFDFQQSADGGKNWTNLFRIFDNGNVYATQFNGALNGNASTANKWKSPIIITASTDVTGNVTFDGSANQTFALTVGKATQLRNKRKINGTDFDGTANITTASWGTARNVKISDGTNTSTAVSMGAATSGEYILKLPTTIKATIDGNAATATKLQTARSIGLSGDVTGSTTFDGSGNVTINATVQDDSHEHSRVRQKSSSNISGITTVTNCNSESGYITSYYNVDRKITGLFPTIDNANSIMTISRHPGNFLSQLGFSGNGGIYYRSASNKVLTDELVWNKLAFITDNVASANKLKTARKIKLAGEVTGETSFDGTSDVTIQATMADGKYLRLTGGTMTGTINSNISTGTHLAGNQGKAIINSTVGAGNYVMLAKMNSTNGYFCIGSYQKDFKLYYTAKSTVDAGTNSVTKQATLLNENGDSSFPGTVTATTFSGNATSADKWKTARTITLTGGANGSVTFDGSGNKNLAVTVLGSEHHHTNATIDNLDGSKITSGTIPLERIPQGALERMVVVADDTARFKLTTANVQLGDVVKVTSTNKMYFVKDQTKLTTEAGYEVFAAGTAASVNWANIQNVPLLEFSNDVTGSVALSGIPTAGKKNVSITVEKTNRLKNKRKINGTDFDGTTNITTSIWGAARKVTIKDYNNTHVGAETSMGAATTDYILHLPNTITATILGNASSANKLAAAKKITFTQKNNTIGSFAFDGSNHVSADLNLVPASHEYHDLLVFGIGSNGFPKFYTAISIDNYTESSLIKAPFDGRDASSVTLDFTTYTSVMWQWDTFPGYNMGQWLFIAGCNTSKSCAIDIIMEASTDNTDWTTVGQALNVNLNATTRWIKISTLNYVQKYIRLKFIKKADGILRISRICLYSARSGDQGSGNEIKYPYTWDAGRNVTFPAKVFATTFYGNATSADKWKTARTITLAKDATGNITFDGSSNVTLNVDIKNDSHDHTYLLLKGTLTNEDLNNYKNDRFEVYKAAGNNTVKNNPAGTGQGFGLLCYPNAGGYKVQELISQGGIKYIRYYISGDTPTWTTWKQVAFITDNVASANKLNTARKIKLAGEVTGEASFDGSGDATIQATMADGKYLRLSGGAMTGSINTNMGGRSGTAIGLYPGDANGTGMVLGAGGRTIIGSGESAQNLRTALGTTTAKEAEELMYITGDSTVTIFTNCQTIANRKAFTFNADGNLTAAKFTGALAGNASTASKWATGRKITATGDATGNVTIDGSADQQLKLDVLTAAKTDYALTVNVKNVAGATTTTTFNGSSAKTINIDATNFMPIFTFTKTLTLKTDWQDLGITGNNIPNTGSYIIQIYLHDGGTAGALSNYQEYYTGVMSWFAAGTNSTDTDEIILHKAGHASNNKYIYLKTVRSSAGNLKMQIAANVTATAASTLIIKVRQLI